MNIPNWIAWATIWATVMAVVAFVSVQNLDDGGIWGPLGFVAGGVLGLIIPKAKTLSDRLSNVAIYTFVGAFCSLSYALTH